MRSVEAIRHRVQVGVHLNVAIWSGVDDEMSNRSFVTLLMRRIRSSSGGKPRSANLRVLQDCSIKCLDFLDRDP